MKSSSVSSFTWNPWKLRRILSFRCCQEYMHHGRSLEYQFVAASSREMMRDFARVASLPLAEAMAALWHMRNLQESVLPWYFGGGAAL
jgi:hypothetical protein